VIKHDDYRMHSPAVGHRAIIVPRYREKQVHRTFIRERVKLYEPPFFVTAHPIVLFKKEKKRVREKEIKYLTGESLYMSYLYKLNSRGAKKKKEKRKGGREEGFWKNIP